MFRLIPVMVAAATLAAACSLALPSRASAACGYNGYSYAGLSSTHSHYGVSAAIMALQTPTVTAGHVAAWVGVGGEGLGPNGTSEWLQAGISAEPGRKASLYYELALPGSKPSYVTLAGNVKLGRSIRLAVLETPGNPGWWRVSVNGSNVSPRIHLPGSHNAWRPMATSESWDGGGAACNTYAFRFDDVLSASQPGGGWEPMVAGVIDTPGYVVRQRTLAGFVASGGA
jgi:hypothetical protein